MTTARMLLSSFICLLTASACSNLATTAELPMRRDCISTVAFEQALTDEELRAIMPQAASSGAPIAGFAVSEEGMVYIQYSSRCREKRHLTAELFRALGLDARVESIYDHPVTPSAETIDLAGESWRDSERWPSEKE